MPDTDTTINSDHIGSSKSLTEALDSAAKKNNSVRFFGEQAQIISQATYQEIRQQALQLAAHLYSLGVKRGDYIGIIAQTRIEFHILFFACQYAGLIPSPLPFTILPGGQQAYEKKLIQYLNILKPALLVSPASIETIATSVGKNCGVTTTTYEALANESHHTPALENYQQTCLKSNELAYVQFSSGSTAEPCGLLITQQAVMANLDLITTKGYKIIGEEQVFTWLPFDHNMGLVFAVLSPINTRSNADFISPATFMGNPGLWLELMSACRTTTTSAPTFAYNLALQKRNPNKHLDLSSLRLAGIGGDAVHAETLRTFANTMKDSGFRFDVFSTGYGLAEAVMAISMTDPRKAPLIYELSDGKHTQELISCGELLPGFEIKFKNQITTSKQQIGEIWIKGPSIVSQSLNAYEKLKKDEDGFIATGDLGFMYKEQLFITGRTKDIIIIRGKNIWPQNIEWAAIDCDKQLNKHSVTAIGITQNGEEHLIVLIQNEHFDTPTRKELETKIQQSIKETFGVKVKIVWTQANQLSTTSVGKLARAQIKQNYISNTLSLIQELS